MNDQYEALYTTFRWWVPQRFNLAEVCCRRWTHTSSDARRIAVYAEDPQGQREVWTFARLQEYANRLSNGLRRTGVQRGDRVAIALPQRPEALVAHLAVYQMGAIAVPLSAGLDAAVFEQRLRDSEARIALVDAAGADALLRAVDRCPLLRQSIGIDLDDERVLPWRSLIARQESAFDMQPTAASDPALLLYTPGTGGAPKGILLPHAALIGNLPGFVSAQDWFPQRTDILWTAFDWAGAQGLFGAVLPCLYFGQPLVASRQPHTAAETLALLERYQVSNAALAPADLRALLQAAEGGGHELALRALAVTGAPLGAGLFERCVRTLDVIPNETYGQAEVGIVAGQSRDKWPARPGSMGRPYPGHQVVVADPSGRVLPAGAVGEILVNRYDLTGHPDPAFFLGYWRGEEAGRPSGGIWHRTGDLAHADEDGYLWFAGRAEDAIVIDGHRFAPEAIEDCLLQLPELADAAVVAVTGAEGRPMVKAFVVRAGEAGTGEEDLLPAAVADHARRHLPPGQAPAAIEFVARLPRTADGRLRRHVLRQQEEERAARQPVG
ncbi:AMP-binding protein [Pigmentiphaga soli]|uniref:AMP-binding protein n=1 Tax=Pigmentiphaga soli TaxID=1007095 RepID=A0ABP8HLS4_9BURK